MQRFFHSARRAYGVRGALALAFGIAALAWPNITVQALVLLVGAYAVADGGIAVAASIRNRSLSDLWWLVLIEGLGGIAAGVTAFVWPSVTAMALVVIIGLWSLTSGIAEIIMARFLGRELSLLMLGILSCALGVFFVAWPHEGVLFLTWLVGIYAVLAGLLTVRLSAQFHAAELSMNSAAPFPGRRSGE